MANEPYSQHRDEETGLRGTLIPSANRGKGGGSKGFDPKKPMECVVDPDYPDRVVINPEKLIGLKNVDRDKSPTEVYAEATGVSDEAVLTGKLAIAISNAESAELATREKGIDQHELHRRKEVARTAWERVEQLQQQQVGVDQVKLAEQSLPEPIDNRPEPPPAPPRKKVNIAGAMALHSAFGTISDQKVVKQETRMTDTIEQPTVPVKFVGAFGELETFYFEAKEENGLIILVWKLGYIGNRYTPPTTKPNEPLTLVLGDKEHSVYNYNLKFTLESAKVEILVLPIDPSTLQKMDEEG